MDTKGRAKDKAQSSAKSVKEESALNLDPLYTITRKSLLYKTGVEYGGHTINHVGGCAHGERKLDT